MYSNNPKYELKFEANGYRVFLPTNIMEGYSTQRYVEALNQDMYSKSGATREALEIVMNEITRRCNDEKNRNIRTEIGALAQSIIYRLSNPVDQHCAIRMGAILSFVEQAIQDEIIENGKVVGKSPTYVISEPEDKIETVWLKKKEELAMNNEEAYTFFLTWGIVNTPSYKEAFDISNALEYFSNRTEAIKSLTLDIKPSSS